jgi:hypothetical protein
VEHTVHCEVGDKVLEAQNLVSSAVSITRSTDTGHVPGAGHPREAVPLAEEVRPSRGTTCHRAPRAPSLSGGLDGIDDALVAGASAEMPGESALDSRSPLGQAALEKVGGADRDSGCAETALNGSFSDEGIGKHLSLPFGQPLQRDHATPSDLLRPELARQRWPPVEQYRATAAHPLGRATFLGCRVTTDLAQHVEQAHPVVEFDGDLVGVQDEADGGHGGSSPLRSATISAAMLIAISSGV